MLTKPKKKQKSDRQLLIEKLDKASKKLVYLRDDYTCQWCGKRDGHDYQASHVIPVSVGIKLRWDLLNMKVLCYHCHLNVWHKDPIKATNWFKQKFPERWDYLEANRGLKKFSLQELEDMLSGYEAQLTNL